MRCACLQDIKKPHTEAVRGQNKGKQNAENGGDAEPMDKIKMHQKSPQVKRHNGPHSRELLLLAIFHYGHRMDVAMEQVENAVRERRRS
jgi:hypothetical protein